MSSIFFLLLRVRFLRIKLQKQVNFFLTKLFTCIRSRIEKLEFSMKWKIKSFNDLVFIDLVWIGDHRAHKNFRGNAHLSDLFYQS